MQPHDLCVNATHGWWMSTGCAGRPSRTSILHLLGYRSHAGYPLVRAAVVDRQTRSTAASRVEAHRLLESYVQHGAGSRRVGSCRSRGLADPVTCQQLPLPAKPSSPEQLVNPRTNSGGINVVWMKTYQFHPAQMIQIHPTPPPTPFAPIADFPLDRQALPEDSICRHCPI